MSPEETEARFTALALLYGAPPFNWIWDITITKWATPLGMTDALIKVFGAETVKRVGTARLTYDFAVWYHTCDDGHGGKMLTREAIRPMKEI